MGTKNNPGKYDCHASAEMDEPLFTLLARDPLAPFLVELWAALRDITVGDSEQVNEAKDCAVAMRKWPVTKKFSNKLLCNDLFLIELVNTIVRHEFATKSMGRRLGDDKK